MRSTDLTLRRATAADAGALAAVQIAARAASPMPPGIHPPDEVRAWLAERSVQNDTWVAEANGAVVGYARFTETWLDDLYVVPSAQGEGVGTALLELVKALRPHGFSLWVFEVNQPARAFYARHGLVEREHTDGSENEEREPDLRMEWAP